MPQPTRLASIKGFSSAKSKDRASPTSAVLFCTSVASRGLDLPFVRAVIQYDLPTEGGATEYVHRVGRTARAGKGGEAWCFVAPSEKAWVEWVEGKMRTEDERGNDEERGKIQLEAVAVDAVLRRGFGGKGAEYEERATEVQLAFERWVLKGKNAEPARKAFASHMRAYATHPSDEKHIFHVRNLHIGHLAKSFALREAPGVINKHPSRTSRNKATQNRKDKKPRSTTSTRVSKGVREKDWTEEHDKDAEARMKEAVRAQGRLSKKKGVLMSYGGTGEFQVASGDVLEKLSQGGI